MWALGVALVATACVEKSKRLSKAEREMAKEISLPAAPKPEHELDVRFENKIRLLGYDLSVEQAKEGEAFTVTWYWKVNQALGAGWKIFTHLADQKRESRINLDAARPVRRVHPVESWKSGEYIKDVQEITLPSDWDSSEAVFYLGFWNGPHRLHVAKGKNDGDNRAEALVVPVGGAGSGAADEKLPRLIARYARGPIALDGKLEESDWGAAQPTGRFVATMSGNRGTFEAGARVLYNAENLYVAFEVQDDYLKSELSEHDDHLWTQDAVEVMIDPDGDGMNYFEIQVAPSGAVFDTAYDTRRKPKPYGKMDWSSDTKAGVDVRGTIGDDEPDKGYTVEMAIPWSSIGTPEAPAMPPAKGATWRINFYVMDARDKGQRAVGWSPPMVGDFHVPKRFGRVVFPEPARPVAGKITPEPTKAVQKPEGEATPGPTIGAKPRPVGETVPAPGPKPAPKAPADKSAPTGPGGR